MDKTKVAKELIRVAKELRAESGFKDGRGILEEYQETSELMDEINEKIEKLKRKKNSLSVNSTAVQEMYDLAKDMRAELGKILKILEKFGAEVVFSNDLGKRPSELLSCVCFLKKSGEEYGMISFRMLLSANASKSSPSLEIKFNSWNRDTNFELKEKNNLDNTLAKWKGKFLKKVLKEMLNSLQSG